MKNKVRVKVNVNSIKFNNFLVYNNIKYDNLMKSKNFFILDIDYSDINKFYKYDIVIVKYYGVKAIINYFKYNKYVILGILISFIMLYLLCNTIFDVKINTNNLDLKNKIYSSLKDHNIYKYKKKKNFQELTKIKDKILEENKDSLEWIEIREDGCDYIIELTERIQGKDNNSISVPSNITAKKDGLITYISLINGVQLKEKNDYVKKGEIIITGEIYKNDKLVDQTSAKGVVYAEVWYTTKVSMPFQYKEYVDTGKKINRYYLNLFGKEMTIVGKYNGKNVMKEKKVIIDKPYLFFDLYKETMKIHEYKNFSIDENQAYKEAILRADASIKMKLKDDEYVIYKKVLKKEVFSSKMVVEVFYKVNENITNISNITEVQNDT